MTFLKGARPLAVGIAIATSAFLGIAPASATVGGGGGSGTCNVTFPSFNQSVAVIAPTNGTIYSLHLTYGTLEAAWNGSALSIAYVKTGGSQITADFQQYGLTSGGVCFYHGDNGSFTESAGETRSFTWGSAVLAQPTEAVMYVAGQGYFGILFYYN